MEHKINQLLPQALADAAVAKPSPAVLPPRVDRSFVDALSGKRIGEASPEELFVEVSKAVELAWFERGFKAIADEEMELLKMNICRDYASMFTAMHLTEIGNAFHHWSREKYGKVYGLTVVVASKLMADYLSDYDRLQGKQSLVPKELPKAKPDKSDLFETNKRCLWLALDRFNTKTPMHTLAPTVYNFLNELGLIIYSTEDKWAFMAEALKASINELRVRIAKEPNEHKLGGLRKQLGLLTAANEPGAALSDEECITMVKNKAKELTLADCFTLWTESEMDINELIESKRAAYEKT